MLKITRWPRDKTKDDDLSDHTFQLIVPKAYDGSKPFGLLVFIHPNNTIDIDRFYGRVIEDVLAKHALIWVPYNNAGNDVMPNTTAADEAREQIDKLDP